ncbi:uncharacterized protein FA14DRAFT_142017 [Meira miltonrushii]|uniref:Uncharacterized protein n=1 Tax=Meira miltonrushii TaxID=1280837 RepID=A0A316VMG0_9BASI|nr:uncharacterized protein FA14DRAFT_142017 [Meira miltonrushii]PWN37593.1 hypothetical protein FA14DRAFT_142017 [Meira miltonrushii]
MSTDSKTMMHLSGADQRESGKGSENPAPSHEKGVENSHLNLDKTDEKSIANKLDQASKQEKREEQAEKEANSKPPTRIAEDHGNKPSRGARVDEQIQLEEEAELRKKGIEP